MLDTPEAGALVVRGGALRIAGFALGHAAVAGRGRRADPPSRRRGLRPLPGGDGARGDRDRARRPRPRDARRCASTPQAAGGPGARRGAEALLGLRVALAAAGVGVAAGVAALLGYDATMVAGAALAAGAAAARSPPSRPRPCRCRAALRIGTVTALDVGRQAATTALMLALVAAGAGLLWFLAIPSRSRWCSSWRRSRSSAGRPRPAASTARPGRGCCATPCPSGWRPRRVSSTCTRR